MGAIIWSRNYRNLRRFWNTGYTANARGVAQLFILATNEYASMEFEKDDQRNGDECNLSTGFKIQ